MSEALNKRLLRFEILKTPHDSSGPRPAEPHAAGEMRSLMARIPELGACPTGAGVRFTAWAPEAREVSVRIFSDRTRPVRDVPMRPMREGIFENEVDGLLVGTLYKFVLDGRELPDPYARFLPYGVHGPARVEALSMPAPRGTFEIPKVSELVIYELHVGTFTTGGTWTSAIERLEYVQGLGINCLEVMPIAEFQGLHNWGYDGAAVFAPHSTYGSPKELRAFIGEAHRRGITVILDVVYNHFGPAGNYLPVYSPAYFTSQHKTSWGDSPAFDEPHLRKLVLENARYWLDAIGFDGLRLDATHAIIDPLPRHVIADIVGIAKELHPKRIVIAEDERNEPALMTDQGLDAVWADDFHHALHVVLTGEQDGYYKAYPPGAATLKKTIDRGWLYEGAVYSPWNAPRGKPASHLDVSRFIYCIQNHDQVGNRAMGTRVAAEAGFDAQCAAAMLLLSLPMVPMIFMGEEWAASTPFLYFTDHQGELGEAITQGRREEFAHFEAFAGEQAKESIPDPQSSSSFEKSRLRWEELAEPAHARVLETYKKMLGLRKHDPVLSFPSREGMSCEVLGELLLVRRTRNGEARTLILNCDVLPAELPFRVDPADILMSSFVGGNSQEMPPRSALLLRVKA